MLTLLFWALLSFAAGVACTLAVGFAIERRVMNRPAARRTVALRLLDEAGRGGGQ